MTPVLQVGLTMLVIAVSYAVILAASTAAFIVVDRKRDIFPRKHEPEEIYEDESPEDPERDRQ
jgi:hypothetical protein